MEYARSMFAEQRDANAKAHDPQSLSAGFEAVLRCTQLTGMRRSAPRGSAI